MESALNEARILEDEDFFDIKISVKHSNPRVMIEAYRMLAEKCDYPLHLGVTEAGPMPAGGVKSAIGIGTLLAEGIGDTIRVSLTDDPVEEVKVGIWILQALGLRKRGLDLVACPSCGRAEVDVLGLTRQVNEALEKEGIKVPLRVAVMGCVVNGPGEAREADLGIAAGKGQGFLVVKGEVKGKVPEDKFVEVLVAEARKMAAEAGRESTPSPFPPPLLPPPATAEDLRTPLPGPGRATPTLGPGHPPASNEVAHRGGPGAEQLASNGIPGPPQTWRTIEVVAGRTQRYEKARKRTLLATVGDVVSTSVPEAPVEEHGRAGMANTANEPAGALPTIDGPGEASSMWLPGATWRIPVSGGSGR